MTTAIAVEIRPAQPISRLAAPSSASTKDSAFERASSETATTSSLGGKRLAALLPPDGFPIGRLGRLFLIERCAFRPVSPTKARALAAAELPFSQPMEW